MAKTKFACNELSITVTHNNVKQLTKTNARKLPVQLFYKKTPSVGMIPYKTHKQCVYWEVGKQRLCTILRQEGMWVNINPSEKGLYWRSVVFTAMKVCVPQSTDR